VLRIICPGCAKRLKVPPEFIGRRTTCPRCGRDVSIPDPAPARPDDKSEEPRQPVTAAPGEPKTPTPANEEAYQPGMLPPGAPEPAAPLPLNPPPAPPPAPPSKRHRPSPVSGRGRSTGHTVRRARRRDRPGRAGRTELITYSVIGALAGGAIGFGLSQYLPVFGDAWSFSAEPESKLRLAYAPLHVLVFGLLGALGLAGVAWLKTRR
jgi:hypothetical protein